MKYTDNAINVMAARTYKSIGRAWIIKNLFEVKSDAEIVYLLNYKYEKLKLDNRITIEGFNKKKDLLKGILEKSKDSIDGVVALGDDDFPPHRGDVKKDSEKPTFIFYRGNLSLLNVKSKNIAVIGLLNPDQETELIEKEVVAGLVEKGAVIVSGLALGCDTIAHKQALESNGHTVAILPSPLNDVMPAKNRGLVEEILKNNGLLISEYLTGAKSKMELRGRYQERDRLQALYSNAIVLSASYEKNNDGNDSGSRLAMEYAQNYSIPRAVIYERENDGDNPKYGLNRQIIDGGGPSVIVINRHNMLSAINDIINCQPMQRSMI